MWGHLHDSEGVEPVLEGGNAFHRPPKDADLLHVAESTFQRLLVRLHPLHVDPCELLTSTALILSGMCRQPVLREQVKHVMVSLGSLFPISCQLCVTSGGTEGGGYDREEEST